MSRWRFVLLDFLKQNQFFNSPPHHYKNQIGHPREPSNHLHSIMLMAQQQPQIWIHIISDGSSWTHPRFAHIGCSHIHLLPMMPLKCLPVLQKDQISFDLRSPSKDNGLFSSALVSLFALSIWTSSTTSVWWSNVVKTTNFPLEPCDWGRSLNYTPFLGTNFKYVY